MKKFFAVMIKFILFFFAWAIIGGIIDLPFKDPAMWRFGAELIPLIVIIAVSMVFWLVEKKNIDIFPCEHIVKSSLIGVSLGILWLGLSIGIIYLLGAMVIIDSNHVTSLWLWILAAFLNVAMQELLVRGYLYQLIKKNYGIVISAFSTTALFVFMHGGAFEAGIIAVLNLVTMSFFMTALLEYTGSLLAPIFAHSVWNIIGSIIFGCVSLADDYPHLLSTVSFGNTLLSGGDYKIEGSIIVLIINVLLCAALCILMLRRKRASR